LWLLKSPSGRGWLSSVSLPGPVGKAGPRRPSASLSQLSWTSRSEHGVAFGQQWISQACDEDEAERRRSALPSGVLCGDAIVAVMEAADFRRRHDTAGRGRLDNPRRRAVLRECEMCAGEHVVRDIAREHPAQAGLVHHDHVIEALASHGADDALNVGVLPRRARRCADGLDMHAAERGCDRGERIVAVMHEIARRSVFWEGIPQLLRRPVRRRMIGNGDMDDSSTVVPKDDQHEQQPERVAIEKSIRARSFPR